MKVYQNIVRLFFIVYLLLNLFYADYYHFMCLNIFLAYIPVEISFWLTKERPKSSVLFIVSALLALLFFPNIPYLLTDLFHLSILKAQTYNDGIFLSTPFIWKNYFILISGILFFVIVGFQQLHQVIKTTSQRFLQNKFSLQWTLTVVVLILSSVGIYWGRVLRLHSVYFFTKPLVTLEKIIGGLKIDMLWFVLGFTVLQFILYGLLNFKDLFHQQEK